MSSIVVVPMTLAGETKFTCQIEWDEQVYVFRYAFDTEEDTKDVVANLLEHLGQPSGILMDLASNYWRVNKRFLATARFTQRTTQQKSYYISLTNIKTYQ